MTVIRFRSLNPAVRPRRTTMDVPGWAGERQPRRDGAAAQPWHCLPFTDAARSAMEVLFPHEDDVRVSVRDGTVRFDGVFGEEDDPDKRRPPFFAFGRDFYAYPLQLDLDVPEPLTAKVETHPRFYTDRVGDVPIAVPALVRRGWPMIDFVVFKTPAPGRTHVFRPNEPMLLLSVAGAFDRLDVVPMNEDEAAERERASDGLARERAALPEARRWRAAGGLLFDDLYRRTFGSGRAV